MRRRAADAVERVRHGLRRAGRPARAARVGYAATTAMAMTNGDGGPAPRIQSAERNRSRVQAFGRACRGRGRLVGLGGVGPARGDARRGRGRRAVRPTAFCRRCARAPHVWMVRSSVRHTRTGTGTARARLDSAVERALESARRRYDRHDRLSTDQVEHENPVENIWDKHEATGLVM